MKDSSNDDTFVSAPDCDDATCCQPTCASLSTCSASGFVKDNCKEEFGAGFKKTMAFQPRVIKQNLGSSGVGIWIIKLKEGNYCASFGERSRKVGEKLMLMRKYRKINLLSWGPCLA